MSTRLGPHAALVRTVVRPMRGRDRRVGRGAGSHQAASRALARRAASWRKAISMSQPSSSVRRLR